MQRANSEDVLDLIPVVECEDSLKSDAEIKAALFSAIGAGDSKKVQSIFSLYGEWFANVFGDSMRTIIHLFYSPLIAEMQRLSRFCLIMGQTRICGLQEGVSNMRNLSRLWHLQSGKQHRKVTIKLSNFSRKPARKRIWNTQTKFAEHCQVAMTENL